MDKLIKIFKRTILFLKITNSLVEIYGKSGRIVKSLVDIPSSSGNESEILIYLEKWLIKEGFDFVVREETFVAGQIKANVNNGQKKKPLS